MIIDPRKPEPVKSEWKRNLRRSMRVKSNFPITVSFTVNGEKAAVPAYVRNMSAEGIGAFIPTALEIDHTVELQFTLPASSRELNLKAIVRAAEDFHYGMEFIELDASERCVLQAFTTP
jgi:hypothetical protein